jgi:iron complex outermembrane receptor protein
VSPSEQLRTKNVTTVNQLLEQMPSVSLQGTNKNANNGGDGFALVDLRNMGTGRTLILVNGRRTVSRDLNNIPVNLVERVEVLLDGASATYGSDAIGGVINFILKENFEGAVIDAQTGISDELDGPQVSASATIGQNFERGNITVHVAYAQEEHIEQSERRWSEKPVTQEKFVDGELRRTIGNTTTDRPTVQLGKVRYFATDMQLQDRFAEADTFNFGRHQWLVGDLRRLSTAMLSTYELGRRIRFYSEATYVNRFSRTNLAPPPLSPAPTGRFEGGLSLPVTDEIRRALAPMLPADAGRIAVARRFVEVGDRTTEIQSNTYRLVTGLRGDVADRRFKWNAYVNVGRSEVSITSRNNVNLARVLETADPARCALNADKGCVQANYLAALPQPVVDYISYDGLELDTRTQLSSAATLSGDLFELPRGTLKFALGGELRHESGSNTPDAVVATGETAANVQQPIEGEFNAGEVFGEISIPFLRRLPGAHDLTGDLSGRLSHFDEFGSELTYRTALTWAPVSSLRLRGSYSTAFRAPTIDNLYGGTADSYPIVDDPCTGWNGAAPDGRDPAVHASFAASCQQAGVPADYEQPTSQLRTNVGGNPDLDAETARVFNAGFVFWPAALDGFSLTGDYYNAVVDDAIMNPNPEDLINGCHGSEGLVSDRCRYIARNALGIPQIDASVRNIGKLETSGFDVALAYRLPVPVGQVDLAWQGNYLLDFTETYQYSDGDERAEREGTIDADNGSYARLRWIARAGYAVGRWSLNNEVRYIGGADIYKAEADPTRRVAATYYWDLSGGYRQETWSWLVGVNNLLDQDPPFIPSGTNSNGSTYDFTGRFVYTRASYRF